MCQSKEEGRNTLKEREESGRNSVSYKFGCTIPDDILGEKNRTGQEYQQSTD